MLIMVAERIVLGDTRIIFSFVLCLVLHPISANFCFSALFLSSRKYLGNFIFEGFFFLDCISLLLKAYERVFPKFRVLMTETKEDVDLSAVDREMVSTCINAQVPEEVLENWEFISSLLAERVCRVTVGWVVLCHQEFSRPFGAFQRYQPPTRGNSFSTGLAAILVFPQPSVWLTFYRKNALRLYSSPLVMYSAYAWLLLFVSMLLSEEQNTFFLL